MLKPIMISAAVIIAIASGAWAQATNTPPPTAGNAMGQPPLTLDEARARAHKRADRLDAMTADQWAAAQKNPHTSSLTLDQARAEAHQRAAKLDSMTADKWAAKHGVPSAPPPAAAPSAGSPY